MQNFFFFQTVVPPVQSVDQVAGIGPKILKSEGNGAGSAKSDLIGNFPAAGQRNGQTIGNAFNNQPTIGQLNPIGGNGAGFGTEKMLCK